MLLVAGCSAGQGEGRLVEGERRAVVPRPVGSLGADRELEDVGLRAVHGCRERVGTTGDDRGHLTVDDQASCSVRDRRAAQGEGAVEAVEAELLFHHRPRRAVDDLLGRDGSLVGSVGRQPGEDLPAVAMQHLPLDALGRRALARGEGCDLGSLRVVVLDREALGRAGLVADLLGVVDERVAVAARAVTDELRRRRRGGSRDDLADGRQRCWTHVLLVRGGLETLAGAPVADDLVRGELGRGGEGGRERAPLDGLGLDDRALGPGVCAGADLDGCAGHLRRDADVVDHLVRVGLAEPDLRGHLARDADIPRR